MSLPKSYIIIVLILSLSYPSIAITINGSNEMRYARRGLGDLQKTDDNWGWFENQLNLDLWQNNWHFNMRALSLNPSEFGIHQSGLKAIDKAYIEFNDQNFKLRYGNFYRNWGRGLILGMIEARELNYDNGLLGFLMEGSKGNLEGAAFYGEEKDAIDSVYERAGGIYISYTLPLEVRVGGSLLHFENGIRHNGFERRGLELEIPFGIGSTYWTYVADSYDYSYQRYSHGLYSSLEFFGNGWSLLLDYNNYRLPKFEQLPLQNPPLSRPEATWTLFDRYPYEPFYDAEVGYQIDFSASVEDWALKWNFNQVSKQESIRILPSLKDRLIPYWASTFSIKHPITNLGHLELLGGYAEQTSFSERWGGGFIYEHLFTNDISTTTEFQYLWNTKIPWYPDYRDLLISSAITKANLFTLTILAECSGDPFDLSGVKSDKKSYRKLFDDDRCWPNLELALILSKQHQLRLFYGYERGGIRCTGGLCRQINPFKGVKVTLNSQL